MLDVYKHKLSELNDLLEAKDNEIKSLNKDISTLKAELNKTSDGKSTNQQLTGRSIDDRTKERIEGYKKTIESYKQDQAMFLQQMQMLKTDIRQYKTKYENLLSYDGRIQDYNDLRACVVELIEKYKPK
jgi:predicted  nucleic acid-binding Zn-ribbon protein